MNGRIHIGNDRPPFLRPKRVVSLVPSLTELLFDLESGDTLVGRTKFCVHPKSQLKAVTEIGGTKNPKLAEILELKPDLILANKEENREEDISALVKAGCQVWVTDVDHIQENIQVAQALGDLLESEAAALRLSESFRVSIESIKSLVPQEEELRVLYLIWKGPYMAAGSDTYINSVLMHCGLKNVTSDMGDNGLRYPEITEEMISDLDIDVVLLSSEPFPFKTKHQEEIHATFGKSSVIVDGEAFSWYGSRLVKSVPFIQKTLHDIKELAR